MKLTALFSLSLLALVHGAAVDESEGKQLEARQRFDFGPCQVTGQGGLNGSGRCRYITDGECPGVSVRGFCPGTPSNVQCCRVPIRCQYPHFNTNSQCKNGYKVCPGQYVPNKCPGDTTIQCCVT